MKETCLLQGWDGINIQEYVKMREICECSKCAALRNQRKQRLEQTQHEVIENQTVEIVFPEEGEDHEMEN